MGGPRAGEELFDLADYCVDVSHERPVVGSLEFDHPCAWDVVGVIPTVLDGNPVVAAMQHEGRNPHGGNDWPDIDLEIGRDVRACHRRTHRHPLEQTREAAHGRTVDAGVSPLDVHALTPVIDGGLDAFPVPPGLFEAG